MKIFPSILILVLFVSSLSGQSKEVQIEQIINNYLSPNSPGLAVMATQGDQVLYKRAFGFSDIRQSKPMHPDQLFRIGSITKQFTATAILKLAFEKQLDLADSIEKYIPEVGTKKAITIQQLLNHTSGLGNQNDIPSFEADSIDGDFPKVKMGKIMEAPLKFQAGSQYAYSNLGYIVLGYVLEQVSGMTYEAYLDTHFFQPLQMNNTGFEYLHDYAASMSQGYSYTGETYVDAENLDMEIPYAAGGLVSSLEDLAIWNRAVMSGQLIPMQYVQQLAEANILPNGKTTEYSMGWQVGQIQGAKSIKHDGIINGYTSSAIYLPEHDLYLVVLSNCDAYRDIELPNSQIAAVLIDQPFETKTINISTKDLATYQGKYQNGDQEMKIVLHNDQLMYYKHGNNKTKLIPTGKHQFLVEGSLDQIYFSGNTRDHYTLSTLGSSETWIKAGSVEAFTSLKISADALDEFVGKYNIQDKMVFEVIRIEDKVYGQMGNDRKEIICFDKDTFCVLEMDAIIRFSRDPDGKIAQVNVKQIGEFSGERMD